MEQDVTINHQKKKPEAGAWYAWLGEVRGRVIELDDVGNYHGTDKSQRILVCPNLSAPRKKAQD